jgi:tetratricopeptide (TPR) repeat protein
MDRERIGKYRILGEVGRGTMGIVYEALDPVLGRRVALKTISVQGGSDEEALQRFRREAQAAALLNHPNIVTIHDYGEEKGILYMAMEFLEGPDLRDAIDEDLLNTLDQKLEVMDKVLDALEYAHTQDVVHRDVKPANIHLGTGRQVKIMDFGLARMNTSEMTQEGIVLGTPNYMSPEQALGDKVDGRSDVFSTGAVLYELLTGHKPFEADSTPSVLFQVVHRHPPPVHRWALDVPVPIVDVVNRALAKDKKKRFSGASEMRAALAAARQGSSPGLDISPSASGGGFTPPSSSLSPSASRSRTGSGSRRRQRARRRRPKAPLLFGAAGLAVVLAGVLAAPWIQRQLARSGPEESDAQVGELTRALVATQAQLAQRELDDKNWAAAEAQALSALHLAPGHAEATAILETARARLRELDAAVAAARSQLEAGDTEAASEQLSRVLELDPRHPAAAELSARLNAVFLTQAEAAAASMSAARDQAVAGGAAKSPEFSAADATANEAEALAGREEYADATRTYLEARDAFDRARRAVEARRQAAARPEPTAAPRPTPTPARAAVAAPASRAAPPAPAVATPRPRAPRVPGPAAASTPAARARHFRAGRTTVTTESAGELAGFDSADVTTQRPPQFEGRMVFEVQPSEVRPGEPFVVRIHLVNEGRKTVKIKDVEVATIEDGQRTAVPTQLLQAEVPSRDRALVAEYAGVGSTAASWTLEAVAIVDEDERVRSRLRSE